jgi:DNA-binding transcriptional ArsR family regulator
MRKADQLKLLDMDALGQAADCLKTLSHPMRLRMVEMLLEGEYTVGELAEACGIQNHAASEHLGKMKDRGLLNCERRGRAVYYKVEEAGLKSIMQCVQKRFG